MTMTLQIARTALLSDHDRLVLAGTPEDLRRLRTTAGTKVLNQGAPGC